VKVFQKIGEQDLIKLIKEGGVGIIPTDTVYGLVCSIDFPESIKRLYEFKGIDHKPGTVIGSSIEQLERLGLKRRYLKAVEEYWPGPVSIIIPSIEIINNLDLGKHSLAVRIPDKEDLVALLDKVGPLLTTGANISGQPTVNNIEEAQQIFKESLDFYVDGGNYSGKQASAVIKIIDDAVEVIRPGSRFN
jgi:L-threonylcarbamoyladenylate synthase